MASRLDDVVDQLSQLSFNSATDDRINSAWLVPYSNKEGFSFRCSLSLKQLIDQQLSESYFRKLLFIIVKEKHIVDFHMKLRSQARQSLVVHINYKGADKRSGPVDADVCISCDMNNPLSKLSLLRENPTTRIWLDGQLREKVVVTPRRHIEQLLEMTKEEMIDFWRDTQDFLDQQQCQWTSMIVNHGNYRNHAHLHMKININSKQWNQSIKRNYREKLQQMNTLLNHTENNHIEMYFGKREFNQWSGIKKRED